MFRFKSFFILLFFLAFSLYGFSQKVVVKVVMLNHPSKPNGDTIYYDINRKLTWADFQGKPDPNHFGAAVTASGFAFNSEMNFDGKNIDLTIHVFTYFTKHDSWKKSNVNSDYHLLHEQHHFDITRLGAQKLAQEFQKAQFTIDNCNHVLNSIFEKVFNENSALQDQYDRETKNSLDVKKQLEWNDRIAAEIARIK